MQKRIIISLIGLALISISAVAQEGTSSVSTASDDQTMGTDLLSDVNRLTIGFKVDSFMYQEPNVMKQDGVLGGVAAKFESKSLGEFSHVELMGSYVQGNVNYNGSLMNGTPVTAKDTTQILEAHGLWVFDIEKEAEYPFSPFIGIGYRRLVDPKDGTADYRREITYQTIPFGLRVGLLGTATKNVNFTFQYDALRYGNAKTYLSDISPEFADKDMRQRKGSGWRLTLDSKFLLASGSILSGSLFWQNWNIGDSDIASIVDGGETIYLVEPENKTRIIGVMGGYTF